MSFFSSTTEELRSLILEQTVQQQLLKRHPPVLTKTPISVVDGKVALGGPLNEHEIEHLILLAKRLLPPQSYGSFVEKRVLAKFGLEGVSSTAGTGDAKHDEIGNIEMKLSVPSQGQFSIQQVRPKRDVPFYLLVLYDVRSRFLFVGFVPKAIILEMLGAQSHGTKESARDNADPEFCLANVRIYGDGSLSENLQRIMPWNLAEPLSE